MRRVLLSILFIGVTLSATEINIAVAANVSYAIDELKVEFAKTDPDIRVRVTLGSSGKLTAQIKNGAPYGLFMSANMKYPQALYDEKIAITEPVVYAEGTLAYLSVRKRDFSKGMAILQDAKIVKIAIANPKTAPYGKATVEALKKAKIYESVKAKFVYGESISQTVSYAVTAAEIGIIATSSLYSSKMHRFKENVNWVSMDPSFYIPIEQGIVLLKYGEQRKAYRTFYDFIFSDRAAEIFKKYGYIIR